MSIDSPRRLRADAARNSERIVRAAQAAFAEVGSGVSLEEIARRAGVGIATLYRHFPSKEELVRAVVQQWMREEFEPAVTRALAQEDPLRGMSTMLETTLTMVSRGQGTLAAARDAGAITIDLVARLLQPLTQLVRRAQAAGQVRADLEPEDMPRLVVMLVSTLRTISTPGDGWRRYLVLVLDALRPDGATPLPPAPPLARQALVPQRPPDHC